MRILITGADMVGCYLARELAVRGDEVTLFELNPNLSYIKSIVDLERVKLIRGNILNLPDLMHALKDSGAERIVHTAALLGAAVGQAPFTGFTINVNGTLHVLEAARALGVKRIVYASSGGVYQRKAAAPMREDQLLEPTSLYTATRFAAEQIGLQYNQLYKMEFIVLRYGVEYGPSFSAQGSLYGGVIEDLITKPVQGQPLIIKRTQPFLKRMDLVYVKDMAQAAAQAVKAEGLKDAVFNIATGELTDLAELVATMRLLLPGANIGLEEPYGPAVEDPTLFPMDIARARAQLGYEPLYTALEGFKDYKEYVEKML